MDVLVRMAWQGMAEPMIAEPLVRDEPRSREVRAKGLRDPTLGSLLKSLERGHPDLAPILENAVHQSDLEIYVNNARIDFARGSDVRLRDGDTVSMFIKEPT